MTERNGRRPSASVTDVSASSIVELKAELYRKQLEYQHQKSSAPVSIEGNFIKGRKNAKKTTLWSKKNPGVQERGAADDKARKVYEHTEEEQLEISRKALEAKSKLYEKMASTGDNAEDEDGQSLYLVDFEKKFIDKAMSDRENRLEKEKGTYSKPKTVEEVDATPEFREDKSHIQQDEEWVDYVDALGRSRKCMKKDLPKFQALDKTIKPSANQISEGQKSTNQVPDLLSEDMRREMLREKWEKEQQEMLDKQDTVHYSNVQFDELRSHGVGYYQFSKDEEERQKEIAKLNKIREETKAARDSKERLKEKRKALLAARLEKVKQRRIAQGKPVPEVKQDTSDSDDETIGPFPPKNENKKSPSPEPDRHTTIREWDLGKPDLLIPQKPTKPRSWVNPRDKRDEDFAPPSFYYQDSKPKVSAATIPPPATYISQTEVTVTITPQAAPHSQQNSLGSTNVPTTVLPTPISASTDRAPVQFKINTSKPPPGYVMNEETLKISTQQASAAQPDVNPSEIEAMLKALRNQIMNN